MITDKANRYAQVFVNGDIIAEDKKHLVAMNIQQILDDVHLDLQAENERLRAQVAELITALKPFANSADDWDFLIARERSVDATDVVPLLIGPYRTARAAIAKAEGGE